MNGLSEVKNERRATEIGRVFPTFFCGNKRQLSAFNVGNPRTRVSAGSSLVSRSQYLVAIPFLSTEPGRQRVGAFFAGIVLLMLLGLTVFALVQITTGLLG